MKRALLAASLVLPALAACNSDQIVAPEDRGVCYYAARNPEGEVNFTVVGEGLSSIELCAKELELMRLRFLRMGGGMQEIDGAYQGSFLFLRREGIFTGMSAEGPRFLLLVRYGDRLLAPGAIQQQ